MPKNKLINLIPQEEFDTSLIGRALKWAMGTFRIIVILTEMVVMAAFLSRFWLDAQNSDLANSIKVRVAQIQSQKDTEDQFRGIQNKLKVFKTIATSPKATARIDLVASKIPQEVHLTNISILEDSASMKGVSGSEVGIAQFVANLKSEKTFKKVSLGSIGSSEDSPSSTVFTIKLTF